MSDPTSPWPTFDRPPAVAFLDVDGTLLAETTTYLFARILNQRGLIRRSFLIRALYHGIQHKLGRLDYGRLVNFGLQNIANIPVDELERIAYENFVANVRPRLYVGGGRSPERTPDAGDGGCSRLVVAGDRSPTALDLSRLHRHPHDSRADRTRAFDRYRRRANMLRRGEVAIRSRMGTESADPDGRSDGLRG